MRENKCNRSIFFPIIVFLLMGTVFLTHSQEVIGQNHQDELRISGASTIQPIVEELLPLYQMQYGRSLRITGGGSGAGIQQVIDGASDIGMVSRALRPEELDRLQFMTVGLDTLVIIVNIRNPIDAMSRALLGRIYSGEIRNWKEIADFDQPILLVNKEIGRSTLDLFEEYSGLLHADRSGSGQRIPREAIEIGSNLESLSLVGGFPGAVGYVSMGTASHLIEMGMPVKILTLDGVEANRANVVSGRYPIRRELNFVFTHSDQAIENFLELFRSAEAQTVISDQGFLPVID